MNYDDIDPLDYEQRHERSPREAYLHAHWTPRYLAAFRGVAHGRVLELGCGSGMYTTALATADAVFGIDISQRFLERATAALPTATFARADAHQLPFADSSFDAVVSIGIFEYLDRPRAFAEIARVLRPGGELVFAVPNRRSPFRATARLVQRLTRSPGCDEPTRGEIVRLCAANQLEISSLEMTDALVWLPDALDRRIGARLYALLDRISIAALSSMMLVHARRM